MLAGMTTPFFFGYSFILPPLNSFPQLELRITSRQGSIKCEEGPLLPCFGEPAMPTHLHRTPYDKWTLNHMLDWPFILNVSKPPLITFERRVAPSQS